MTFDMKGVLRQDQDVPVRGRTLEALGRPESDLVVPGGAGSLRIYLLRSPNGVVKYR